MTESIKILIIDDDTDFRKLLSTRLKKIHPEATITEYDILAKKVFPSETECSEHDVLFLDHDVGGDKSGVSWYVSCNKREDFPATIMLTSLGNKHTAIYALNSGVHYYLVKQNLTEEKLQQAIDKAMDAREMRLLLASQYE